MPPGRDTASVDVVIVGLQVSKGFRLALTPHHLQMHAADVPHCATKCRQHQPAPTPTQPPPYANSKEVADNSRHTVTLDRNLQKGVTRPRHGAT